MEKISIIVPVYNVQKYLTQCLESVLNQSYPNWEAILVDDGSTDNSGNICDTYAKKDARFKVIHKINEGAANAKNTGLDCVTGKYVAFIDSDDYVERKWLEKVISVMKKENAEIVEFNFDNVFRSYSRPVNDYENEVTIFSTEQYLEQYVDVWSSSIFCNKIFLAKIIDQIRFHKERRCIDDEFFTYKVITNAKKIVRINDIFYHYRQRASSAVSNKENQLQITNDALDVLIERYEWICDKFPRLRKKYLWHDINIMFFFAGYTHNTFTIKKYRKVSKYYLKELLRYKYYDKLLILALKLQLISNKILLQEEKVEKKIEDYFE